MRTNSIIKVGNLNEISKENTFNYYFIKVFRGLTVIRFSFRLRFKL